MILSRVLLISRASFVFVFCALLAVSQSARSETGQPSRPGTATGNADAARAAAIAAAEAAKARAFAAAMAEFQRQQEAARKKLEEVQERKRQAKLQLKLTGERILRWGSEWAKRAAGTDELTLPAAATAAGALPTSANARKMVGLAFATQSAPKGKGLAAVPTEGVEPDDIPGLRRIAGEFKSRMGGMVTVTSVAMTSPADMWKNYPSDDGSKEKDLGGVSIPDAMKAKGASVVFYNFLQDMTNSLNTTAKSALVAAATPGTRTGTGTGAGTGTGGSTGTGTGGGTGTGTASRDAAPLWRFVDLMLTPFAETLAYALPVAEIALGQPGIVDDNALLIYRAIAEEKRVMPSTLTGTALAEAKTRATQDEIQAIHNGTDAAKLPDRPDGGPFFRRAAKAFQESIPDAVTVLKSGVSQLDSLLGRVDASEKQLNDLANQEKQALADLNKPAPKPPGGGSGGTGSGNQQANSGGGGGGGGNAGGGNAGGSGNNKGDKGETPKPPEMAKMEVPTAPNFDSAKMDDVQPVAGLGPSESDPEGRGRGALPGGAYNNFPLTMGPKPGNSQKLAFYDPARGAAVKPTSSLLQGSGSPGSPLGSANGSAPDGGAGLPTKGEFPGSAGAMAKGAGEGSDGVFNVGKDDGEGGRFVNNFVKTVAYEGGGSGGGGSDGGGSGNVGGGDDAAGGPVPAIGKADAKGGFLALNQIKQAKPSVLDRVRMLGIMGYVGTFGELCKAPPGEGVSLGICSHPRPGPEARAAMAATLAPLTAEPPATDLVARKDGYSRRDLAGARDGAVVK